MMRYAPLNKANMATRSYLENGQDCARSVRDLNLRGNFAPAERVKRDASKVDADYCQGK